MIFYSLSLKETYLVDWYDSQRSKHVSKVELCTTILVPSLIGMFHLDIFSEEDRQLNIAM